MTSSHAFNLTGVARKPLIEAIESFTHVKGVYQGAPKFGYAFCGIGVLDKAGTLHFDCDMQVIMDCVTWLEDCGFVCDTTPRRTADPAAGENDRVSISVPNDFTEAAYSNLLSIIESKATLIQNAFGIESAAIERTQEYVQFPWFPLGGGDGEMEAYTDFVCAICKAAKEAKRVTAKDKPSDNEKFSFRVFLIRLGFVGDRYKDARKILLRNLSGNSAFRHGRPDKPAESTYAEAAADMNSLEEALADAELIHAVNALYDGEGGVQA